MITHAMLRFSHLVLAITLRLAVTSPAIDYQQLSAAKRLAADKRYDEAIQKLEVVAAKTDELGENYSYLALAIDIAVKSLKDADRALALVAEIKDAAYRDFAQLNVLTDFRRYDEALASVQGKDVDTWPVRCRGQAHGMLAEIYHKKKDETAELEQWHLAANALGAEVGVRGRAFREAGVIHLKRGDTAKAEEQFRQALAVTPAGYAWRTESLLALSGLLIQSQRAKEAVKLFDGTDFTKMENLNARANLLEARARALLAAGKKIKAIETFDQLLQLNLPATWKDRINTELDRMAEDL
jgi:tetratricopeptide (TPR) repeat protein